MKPRLIYPKTFVVTLLFGVLTANSASASVSSLDDLNYWGSGTHRTGLTVTFNDGKTPSAIAWGYKWDSATTPTVADMLLDLAASDSNLFLRIDSDAGGGMTVFGFGYQTSSNFGIEDAQLVGNPISDTGGGSADPVTFTDGVDDLNTTPETDAPYSSAAVQPGDKRDRYIEGWFDRGFMSLYTPNSTGSNLPAPADWSSSFVGVSDTDLIHDSWIGFSFDVGFNGTYPPADSANTVAAVPEHSSLPLIFGLIASVFFATRRKVSRHK